MSKIDKSTMSLADEMDEAEEAGARPEEDSGNAKPKPAKKKARKAKKSVYDQVTEGNPYAEDGKAGKSASAPAAENVMSEEDIQQSNKAFTASTGENQIKIALSSSPDSLFIGTLFIGSPEKQVRVIFDTGSEHLAIASDMCKDCPTKPYSLAASNSSNLLSNDTKTVLYGSAKFAGKETADRACVNQGEGCINFKFLSLEQGTGLDKDADGILGLSPEMSTDRADQHLIWSLMKQKQISKASFSLSLSDSNSFAVLGGIDDSQIVGGSNGLRPFRNNPDIFSHIKAWALSGKGLFYGLPQIGDKGTFPAVIDTGSTMIAVPTPLFSALQQKWGESVKDLDCKGDFCQTSQKCDTILSAIQPVGFLIAGGSQAGGQTVFEVKPDSYLFQTPDFCQFGIAENKLDHFNNKNIILGQLFLKHFYTVFNYENEQISLGVNVNSKDNVRMY